MCSTESSDKTEKKLNVVLIKTNDNSDQSPLLSAQSNAEATTATIKDKYVEYLKRDELSYLIDKVEHVNLLSFEYCNMNELSNELKSILLNNNRHVAGTRNDELKVNNYKCLILTSRQTIEAIEHSLSIILDSVKKNEVDTLNLDSISLNKHEETGSNIEKFIVYCVGTATANRFTKLIERLKKYNESIEDIIDLRVTASSSAKKEKSENSIDKVNENKEGDKHVQNGLELSRLIVDDFNKDALNHKYEKKYALYPCSSIRKDDIPSQLKLANLTFDELVVYKTTSSKQGIDKLDNLLISLLDEAKLNDARTNCLVFFSPSGVEAAFESKFSSKLLDEKNQLKFISLGPSTTSKLNTYLTSEHGKETRLYELNEPSVECLVDKLKSL